MVILNALGKEINSESHNGETEYLNCVNKILNEGELKPNRTGVPAYSIAGFSIQHNLELGFPLLTTKKIPFKLISAELEGFIKGITDKKWFQDRNCHIWDEWCNPKKVPYGTDEISKAKMLKENDLGFIYGYQWRNFNSQNFDQLKAVIDGIKKDKYNRRLVCSAWNPLQLGEMALPPCHLAWHVVVIGDRLNLSWYQRSCDTMLGVPFNLASYSLLATLIAKECGLIPSLVTGFLSDVHIYQNHIEGAKTQVNRTQKQLPQLKIDKFKSIFDWKFDDCSILQYNPHDAINFEIAV